MRLTVMMAMATLAGMGAQGSEAPARAAVYLRDNASVSVELKVNTEEAGTFPSTERQVTVCMDSTGEIALKTRAKAIASGIFAAIGVKILWHSLTSCPAEGILITFSIDTPDTMFPGALAYALPYERTHIVVFYNRVKNRPGAIGCVLGHVIVHEVTHILQGVARHSESGVMRERWTSVNYQQMTWKPLQFTPEDVLLINRGLEEREKHLVSVPAGATNGSGTAVR